MTAAVLGRADAGPALIPVDIGHDVYAAVTDPSTAFWALVDKTRIAESLAGGPLLDAYRDKADTFARELHALRFELKPSGVYLNPTERCNLNCTYCYLPGAQRSGGSHMPAETLIVSLDKLRDYFRSVMPEGRKPRAIFHGAEPLMNKDAVFAAIDAFADDFTFGLQTNGTLLDDAAVEFFTSRNVSIGLSLDGPSANITDATRRTWGGKSVHAKVLAAMEKLKGYGSWSVITTCTTENLPYLTQMVEFFHASEVPTCMLNTVRCTLPDARGVKPADGAMAKGFLCGHGPHARALPRKRTKARGRQLRQRPHWYPGADGAAADVRHLALRRRPRFLRPCSRRRSLPVQRVHRPAAFQRRQPADRGRR